jgi:transposase InsO family protein
MEHGITHQLTVPYTPQQNGTAERLNRTLLNSKRSMLKQMNCDKIFWAEAVTTACYIKNRVTIAGLPKTNNSARNMDWSETRCWSFAGIWLKVLVYNSEGKC